MFKKTKNKIKPFRRVLEPFSSTMPQIIANIDINGKETRVNSLRYRSDEFTHDHDGLHILFAGCSNTFGDGLEEDETWAKILYNKISKKEKVSGFFNIGTPGYGITSIINDIFKYSYNFGKPDVIFINFPTSRRFYWYRKKDKAFFYHNMNEPEKKTKEIWEIIPLIEYQYLFMLEQFCKAGNIKLIYGTWDRRSLFSMYDNLHCFTDINNDECITNYIIDNPNNPLNMNARDGRHYGLAFHHAWAEVMYNRYTEISK